MELLIDHLVLYFFAIGLAVLIGLVTGIATAKSRKLNFLATIANILQSAPDIVLLALAITIFGIGIPAALAALFVKGILPVLRNTNSGIRSIDDNIIEAARGMGMSEMQVLFRVQIPLAIPVILTGIRISSVMTVSTLTLSTFIGVKSLGLLIVQGIESADTYALLTGSVLTALLALGLTYLIKYLESSGIFLKGGNY